MKTSYLLLSAALLFLTTTCDSISDSGAGDTIKTNRNAWQKQGIENYSFEYSKFCYCFGIFNPATIVVQADTIHAVLDTETGDPLRDPETNELILSRYPDSFQTIDELFEVIENAHKNADKLDVDYDQTLGYPKNIAIDYMKEAIDDEISYKIENFQMQ